MKKRARGGIGKRKRLKISRVKTLPGSSPGAPTTFTISIHIQQLEYVGSEFVLGDKIARQVDQIDEVLVLDYWIKRNRHV